MAVNSCQKTIIPLQQYKNAYNAMMSQLKKMFKLNHLIMIYDTTKK